jgi:hypothetical protein
LFVHFRRNFHQGAFGIGAMHGNDWIEEAARQLKRLLG